MKLPSISLSKDTSTIHLTISCSPNSFLKRALDHLEQRHLEPLSIQFSPVSGKDNFYSGQITLCLDDKYDPNHLQTELQLIAQEPSLASMLLSTDHDLAELALSHDFSRSTLTLLSQLSQIHTFQNNRSADHLVTIAKTYQRCTQRKQHIQIESFTSQITFPLIKQSVLSVCACIREIESHQIIGQESFVLACQKALPISESVPNSFYSYYDTRESLLFLYIELSKPSPYTRQERSSLEHLLPRYLVSQQKASYALLPPNDEERLRIINLLCEQIHSNKSLPQLHISFRGENEHAVYFEAVLVASCKHHLSAPLDTGVLHFSPLHTFACPSKKAPQKHTLCLEIACKKKPFIRSDNSVDTLTARTHIVCILEESLGELRDANGGLYTRQQETLEKSRLLLHEDESYALLEQMFHNIAPSLIKCLLPPEQLIEIFRQLQKTDASPKITRNAWGSIATCFHYKKEIPPTPEGISTASLKYENKTTIAVFYDKAVLDASALTFLEQLNTHSSKKLCAHVPFIPDTLDPRMSSTEPDIINRLFEGLMRLSHDKTPTPAIAEQIRLNSEKTLYTFVLRPCFWSSGALVTASDFAYAWRQALHPHFPAEEKTLLFPIKNAQKIAQGHLDPKELGVRALSENVLQVELEKPFARFPELCARAIYSPIPENIDEKHPGWQYPGSRYFQSNGAYMVEKWKNNRQLTLRKNRWYHNKDHVHIEQIAFSPLEHETSKTPSHTMTVGRTDLQQAPLFLSAQLSSARPPP